MDVKRLGEVLRSTEEELTKATDWLPFWLKWVILAATIFLLIVELWR